MPSMSFYISLRSGLIDDCFVGWVYRVAPVRTKSKQKYGQTVPTRMDQANGELLLGLTGRCRAKQVPSTQVARAL
jgi:hypothetical protein